MRGGGQTVVVGGAKKDGAKDSAGAGAGGKEDKDKKAGGGKKAKDDKGEKDRSASTSSSASAGGASGLVSGTADGMSKDARSKRASELVEEYCRIGDMGECRLTIEELGPSILGPMVLKVMNKYVDCSKPEPQTRMEELLTDSNVATWLSENREDVEAAVKACELLQLLSDTIVECKKAPEWLGKVVGLLVKAGACSNEHLLELVQDDIGINVDELCSDEALTIEYYNRFMDTVAKTTK
jgi:hypothetical protein